VMPLLSTLQSSAVSILVIERKDFVASIEYAAPLYFRSTVGDFVIALPSSRNCSFIFSICSFR
jgi:hypothetical protein